jgi:hypothetical protein
LLPRTDKEFQTVDVWQRNPCGQLYDNKKQDKAEIDKCGIDQATF